MLRGSPVLLAPASSILTMRVSLRAREHERVRRPTAVLGALLATGAALLPAGPAAAGQTLVPGGSQTLVVALPDWALRADALGVSVTSLVQFENGCVEPESEAGDQTCGADAGELADFLDATVAPGIGGKNCRAGDGDGVTLDLFGDPSVFDVERVDCLVLRLSFPDGESGKPDDLAQSDGLEFTLDVVGERELGTEPARGGEDDTDGADPADGVTVDPTTSGHGADPGVPADPAGTGRAGAGSAGVAVPVPGDAAPPADTSVVGQVATPVTVDEGLAVTTESATSSLAARVLSGGSLFLGAVVLGGMVFMLVRHRRREGAA